MYLELLIPSGERKLHHGPNRSVNLYFQTTFQKYLKVEKNAFSGRRIGYPLKLIKTYTEIWTYKGKKRSFD